MAQIKEDFYNHEVVWDYVSSYTGDDGYTYNVYTIDKSTVPRNITKNGLDYIYVGETGTNYLAFKYSHYEIATPIQTAWEKTDTLTKIKKTPGDIVKASTCSYDTGGVTFVLDSAGNLFCTGGNTYGALGLGYATGEYTLSNDGRQIPNRYVKKFTQVPGTWLDVSVSEKGKLVWAIKDDGSLWTTGDDTEGVNSRFGWSMTNNFTKRDDGPWEKVCDGMLYTVSGDKYKLGLFSYTGAIQVFEMTVAEWNAYILEGFGKTPTPPEYFTALEGTRYKLSAGAPPYMGHYSFIGGSLLDRWNKPAGTLWRMYEQGEESDPPVLISNEQWSYVAGAAIPSGDGDETTGCCIAVKKIKD